MERLTKKEELAGHTVSYLTDEDCFDVWSVPKKFMGKGIEKLADYEDTGLEPEEIIALCDMDSRAKMAEMLKTEEYYGVPIDRLKELAKADSEERCIILPIKEGTLTWNLYWPIFDDEDPEIYESNFLMRDIEALGKTVFLTREEAEKALEEYNG